MLRKLSVLIGLTETEIKVLLFLLSTLLIGFCYKTFILHDEGNSGETFDYSREDSLFFSSGNDIDLQEDIQEGNESVDYKHEVLDFNADDFNRNNDVQPPAAKSINLNTALVKDLVLLPGIGEKTAERIIELRIKRGKFKSLNELLDVKGIGDAKFQNISKYIFIE